MKIILTSGGFDPVHSGHIQLFKEARELGDCLVVGLNSDEWLYRKKGAAFMPFEERASVLRSIRHVDHVVPFLDDDDTANSFIDDMLYKFCGDLDPDNELIFAKGGDRTIRNTPEMTIDHMKLVSFVFGVGGNDKRSSSSILLRNYARKNNHFERTETDWGDYAILDNSQNCKTQEISIKAEMSTPYHKHAWRSENIHIKEGLAQVFVGKSSGDQSSVSHTLSKNDFLTIECGYWHQIKNIGNCNLRIIETQYGDICEESDMIISPYNGGEC